MECFQMRIGLRINQSVVSALSEECKTFVKTHRASYKVPQFRSPCKSATVPTKLPELPLLHQSGQPNTTTNRPITAHTGYIGYSSLQHLTRPRGNLLVCFTGGCIPLWTMLELR